MLDDLYQMKALKSKFSLPLRPISALFSNPIIPVFLSLDMLSHELFPFSSVFKALTYFKA